MARIPPKVAYDHRKQDAEFAQQWHDAEAEAIELLHSQTFRRALEGDLEPIPESPALTWGIYDGSLRLRVGFCRSKSQVSNVNYCRLEILQTDASDLDDYVLFTSPAST